MNFNMHEFKILIMNEKNIIKILSSSIDTVETNTTMTEIILKFLSEGAHYGAFIGIFSLKIA